jgi:hypothetical protein
MADNPSLDDNAAVGAEERTAAEYSAASTERRMTTVPAPRPRRHRTGSPHRSLHLVEEALGAALIADASQHDLEFVVVADETRTCAPAIADRTQSDLEFVIIPAHACCSDRLMWLESKRRLKNRDFCLLTPHRFDRRHPES